MSIDRTENLTRIFGCVTGRYWSGYFTSRANSKSQNRFASANLHASNKLYAEKAITQSTTEDEVAEILRAKEAMFDAMGVNQHHDAITGTAKQAVSDNYAELIGSAMSTNNAQFSKMIESSVASATSIESTEW